MHSFQKQKPKVGMNSHQMNKKPRQICALPDIFGMPLRFLTGQLWPSWALRVQLSVGPNRHHRLRFKQREVLIPCLLQTQWGLPLELLLVPLSRSRELQELSRRPHLVDRLLQLPPFWEMQLVQQELRLKLLLVPLSRSQELQGPPRHPHLVNKQLQLSPLW